MMRPRAQKLDKKLSVTAVFLSRNQVLQKCLKLIKVYAKHFKP